MTVNENIGEKGLPGEKPDEKEIQKKLGGEAWVLVPQCPLL